MKGLKDAEDAEHGEVVCADGSPNLKAEPRQAGKGVHVVKSHVTTEKVITITVR